MEKQKPQSSHAPRGTPYKDMRPKQKVLFILKLVVCIMTFGMAFPNIMSE